MLLFTSVVLVALLIVMLLSFIIFFNWLTDFARLHELSLINAPVSFKAPNSNAKGAANIGFLEILKPNEKNSKKSTENNQNVEKKDEKQVIIESEKNSDGEMKNGK